MAQRRSGRRRLRKVPARVRELRQSAGLTQRELAFRLGVKPHTVSTWETGRQRMPALSFVAVRWVCEHAGDGAERRWTARAFGRLYRFGRRRTRLRGTRALPAGDIVRTLRHAAGLTQRELTARLGSGVGTVSDWERGRHPVRLIHLIGLFAVCCGGARAE